MGVPNACYIRIYLVRLAVSFAVNDIQRRGRSAYVACSGALFSRGAVLASSRRMLAKEKTESGAHFVPGSLGPLYVQQSQSPTNPTTKAVALSRSFIRLPTFALPLPS